VRDINIDIWSFITLLFELCLEREHILLAQVLLVKLVWNIIILIHYVCSEIVHCFTQVQNPPNLGSSRTGVLNTSIAIYQSIAPTYQSIAA